jgi:transglutaminase-like putative cysteine protease
MSWRISIKHTSGYRYASEVRSSYDEARITPLSTPRQITLEARVEVSPGVRPRRYWDYWGTCVDAFDIHVPHSELVVTGTSVVETATPVRLSGGIGWEGLRTPETVDRLAELLAPTTYTQPDERLASVAEELAAGARTPADAAMAVTGWVREQLTYESGSTGVRTSATEALAQGAGVCQDFVHVSLAVLRSMGIPSRYVSGYLHPFPDAGIGQPVTGQSHAWLEWWDGDWKGFDPTNGVPVGERHVLVGRARDYADVTPLKGIFQGERSHTLGVDVELTRTG